MLNVSEYFAVILFNVDMVYKCDNGNALNTVTSARKIFLLCTEYNTKTQKNGCLSVKTAYLKLKPITVPINMEVLGRDKTTFDVVYYTLPKNSSILLPSAPLRNIISK